MRKYIVTFIKYKLFIYKMVLQLYANECVQRRERKRKNVCSTAFINVHNIDGIKYLASLCVRTFYYLTGTTLPNPNIFCIHHSRKYFNHARIYIGAASRDNNNAPFLHLHFFFERPFLSCVCVCAYKPL